MRKKVKTRRESLGEKISLMNGVIIMIGFTVMILLTTFLNYGFSVEREKQKMDVYLSNSIRMVDDKLKDMGRVSLISFSDRRTQQILKEYKQSSYKEQLESVKYLKNLYASLITIRNDISGIYMFDLEQLLFYQDSYAPSLRKNYNFQKYITYLTEIEDQYRAVANCKVVLDTQPAFMRFLTGTTESREDNYCIYFIREIKSFSPNVKIGYMVLTSPVKVTRKILEEYLEPETTYMLTTEDGSIACADRDEYIGENLEAKIPQIFTHITEERGDFKEKYDGQEYLFSYQKSPFSGMILITGVPNKRFMEEAQLFIQKSIIILVILLFVTIKLTGMYTRKRMEPLRKLSNSMAHFNLEDMSVRVPVQTRDETGILMESFNQMMDMINRLIEQEYKSKVRIKESELNENRISLLYLKNQINSHFLYNTLDNIRMKAELDGSKEVSYMIMLLVDFFRLSVRVEEQMVPLEREIRLISVYLKLMCYRYPSLECEYDVEESLKDCLIPNFILQPIVENSVLHGLKAKGYKGKIMVSVHTDADKPDIMIMKVYDNGSGISDTDAIRMEKLLSSVREDTMQDTRQEENHIGIANVQKRLKIYYPQESGLTYTNNPEGGVTVTIMMKKM